MKKLFINEQDTIYAFATNIARSGVSVLRISGANSLAILNKLSITTPITPRIAKLVTIKDSINQEIIDQGLVLYFPAPNSFTGEDVVELHLHGSIAVINHMLQALEDTKLGRLAEAGEFTQRAFLNNKFDLTQAEGLADLIDAETKAQKNQAFNQMSGSLKILYSNWREDIIKIMALFEAYIDFPEEDIPDNVINNAKVKIANLKDTIQHHLNDNKRGERLRNGINIALLGAPNVGKSSLLNYLAKRDVAIVSNIAGTTRDIIEVHLDLDSIPVTISDTAGIRESNDVIEKEGIKRSLKKAEDADLKIVIFDASENHNQNAFEELINNSIIVVNKIDLNKDFHDKFKKHKYFAISINKNLGLEELINEISKQAKNLCSSGNEPIITRSRYRIALNQALEILENINFDNELEIIAEDLRSIAYQIGKITGHIDVEEILGEIFSNFCIGK